MSAGENTSSSSRPSNLDGSQQGLISLFDVHLTFLADSYLSFFQERKKIEETYIESLVKLHRRVKGIDIALDDRSEASSTRRAWNEVRDNVEREAQARQAFLATLSADVVQPLTSLKESQDRTRKRIKEDLKDSSSAYTDFAENILPKLKRTYLKKCQDVEDYKSAAASPPSPTITGDHNLISNFKSNLVMPSRPVVTSPQPLRPIERRASGSVPSSRNRSPSAATPFSDLAHQGKKQLNQLIGFLDKGTAKEISGNRSGDNALRAVRAKREADEADKEYRKAVYWLETLRLRRTKTLEGGYKSLEMFIHESAATVKLALEKYTDNLTATTTTETQLSDHARKAVDKISPEKDVSKLSSSIPRFLAIAIPKPILYHNHSVGECADLIFGVSLVDYATARGLADNEIPKIVQICIKEIDTRGLECEGIYRVSGRHAVVQSLQHKIERNEREFEFKPLTDDVYAVSSLLKLYLRGLPEPLFKYPLQDRIQHSEDLADHQSNNFMLLRGKMRRLPAVHQATLKAIVEHLARVVALNDKNKMDAKNLAIAFGGVIFGEDEMPKGGDLLGMQTFKDSLMDDLIINSRALFDESPPHRSPPLPPTPAGEPVPNYVYGTSHTKVASVPPGPLVLQKTSEDFTPPLPPRPANSIHPSLRANNTSPTKERKDVPPPLPSRPEQSLDAEMPPPSPPAVTTLVHAEEGTESSTLEGQTPRAENAPASQQQALSSSSRTSISQLDSASASQITQNSTETTNNPTSSQLPSV